VSKNAGGEGEKIMGPDSFYLDITLDLKGGTEEHSPDRKAEDSQLSKREENGFWSLTIPTKQTQEGRDGHGCD